MDALHTYPSLILASKSFVFHSVAFWLLQAFTQNKMNPVEQNVENKIWRRIQVLEQHHSRQNLRQLKNLSQN